MLERTSAGTRPWNHLWRQGFPDFCGIETEGWVSKKHGCYPLGGEYARTHRRPLTGVPQQEHSGLAPLTLTFLGLDWGRRSDNNCILLFSTVVALCKTIADSKRESVMRFPGDRRRLQPESPIYI